MDCPRVRSLLEEYFEGMLPESQSEVVAKHIETCTYCVAELAQIERMVAAFEAVPAAVPSEHLLRAITARVAELPARHELLPAWRRAWRWAAAAAGVGMAAAGLAMVVLGVLVWKGYGPSLPGSGGIARFVVFLRDWIGATWEAAVVLWGQVLAAGQALGLALKAAAPTLGVYVAAEIGILLAVVLVLRLGRRREAVRPLVLV